MIEFQQQLALKCKYTSVLDLLHNQAGIHHGESYKGISLVELPQDLCSCENLSYQFNPEVIVEACINMGEFACWLYDQFPAAPLENINAKRTVIDMDLDIAAAEANPSSLQSIKNSRVTINSIKYDFLDKSSTELTVDQVSRIIDNGSFLSIEDSGRVYEINTSVLSEFLGLLAPAEWFIVEDTCCDIVELLQSPELPASALSAVNELLEANPDVDHQLLNRRYSIACHPHVLLREMF
jgi:cephalosporin hydroxylase